jgi:hypothetical protein
MENAALAITSWGDAIFASLVTALTMIVAFIPKLLGAVVILFVGWIIARVVEGLVARGLRLVRFNQIADRAEIDQFLEKAGVRMDPSSVVGKLAYWFLMLIFIGAAFTTFGLTQVNQVINQVIAYIPNVIVALVVLLVGALAANFVANLVRGASGTARVGDPGLLATFARAAILVFAALIALDQLEIAPTIINTLWTAIVGMFAVAGALAFGLGGRDIAHQMLRDWYDRRREMTDSARRKADATRPAATRGEDLRAAPRPEYQQPAPPERRAA